MAVAIRSHHAPARTLPVPPARSTVPDAAMGLGIPSAPAALTRAAVAVALLALAVVGVPLAVLLAVAQL